MYYFGIGGATWAPGKKPLSNVFTAKSLATKCRYQLNASSYASVGPGCERRRMADDCKPLITALEKEVWRLEKLAVRFKKSHSIHLKTTQDLIDSIKKQIERMKAGHA
jgi:predicted small metal-binding protein